MEKRPYGKTGEMLSVVGFGGMVVRDETPADAARFVAGAIERGVNYFDVAPAYGNAQDRLGPALKPYRNSVFLACKTRGRTRDEAAAELRRSLQILQTDHFDLYQCHAVNTLEEVEQITGPGGALEALVEARQQGLVRYLGFSCHSDAAGVAMLERFPFDSVLYPINWVCWHQGNFGRQLLAKAQELGAARLAIKALCQRALAPGEERVQPKCWYAPVTSAEEANLALRFTLSLPVTAAVCPSHNYLFDWACDAAEQLRPLSGEEMAEVGRRSEGLQPLFST